MLGKVLRKPVLLDGLLGKKPPVHVVAARVAIVPGVHPVKARAVGLGVKPAEITALSASTMLAAQSAVAFTANTAAGQFAVVGAVAEAIVSGMPVPLVVPNALPIKSRRPS